MCAVAQLHIDDNETDEGSEVLERYHESNPRSITAARMCIEFGDRLGFDSERVLSAYLDFVSLEYSNLPAIHTMVHYLVASLCFPY